MQNGRNKKNSIHDLQVGLEDFGIGLLQDVTKLLAKTQEGKRVKSPVGPPRSFPGGFPARAGLTCATSGHK